MPKVKISEYSATANSNTDVASINIDEGCAPSGINNAIRAVMGHLKDFQQGTNGDPFNGPVNGTLGATTASTANVTTLTTSSTVTHNGGTANGVAYLNGSKVLTTGSALTFNGSKLGIGVSSFDVPLQVQAITGGLSMRLNGRASPNDGYSDIGFYNSANTTQHAGIGAATSGLILATNISAPIQFQINNAEAGRFDSSGNLLVGATSGSYHKLVKNSPGDWATQVSNTSTTPYGLIVSYSAVAPNSSIAEFFSCNDTVGQKMVVRSNGGIANYSANNVNLSDRREKINFAPAKSYLDVICAIPVQTFNYIDQNMEEDGGLTLGVVAQDVQAVAPELVMESNWAGKDEEPKMRLGIYQTDLQYALMKCIQEQSALITQLTARITALESA